MNRVLPFLTVSLAFAAWLPAQERGATDTGAPKSIKRASFTLLGPGGCPDVAVDARDAIHIAFVRDETAFYGHVTGGKLADVVAVSPKGAKAWGKGERSARLALGTDNRVHVAWNEPGKPTTLWVSTSTDGGKTFALKVAPRDRRGQGEEALSDIACDPAGNVWVAWMDARTGQDKDSPVSADVFVDVSRDGGKTFGKDQEATVANPARACPCCRPTLLGGNPTMLAVRGGEKNNRDVFLVRLGDAIERGACPQPDNWEYEGCPMDGPSLAGDPGKRWVAAWKSEDKLRVVLLDGDKPQTLNLRFTGVKHPCVALAPDESIVIATEITRGFVRCLRVPNGSSQIEELPAPNEPASLPQVVVTKDGAVHLFATGDKGIVWVKL